MGLFIPEGDNLVTYYMLPLIRLNKKTFGRKFVNSYISKDGLKLYVELKAPLTAPELYTTNKSYVTEVLIGSHIFILFAIPSMYIPDALLFIEGKYSQMSKITKALIYTGSGLMYNKSTDDFKISHPLLQALAKSNAIKDYLEDYLGVRRLPENAEYLSVPDESCFIENVIEQLKEKV